MELNTPIYAELYYDKLNFIEKCSNALFKEIQKSLLKSESKYVKIALSGGSTPLPIYRDLSKRLYKLSGSLDRLLFFLVDERVCDSISNLSNQKNIYECLTCDCRELSERNFIFPDTTSAETSLLSYQQSLKKYGTDFDLVTLGLGLDGHIASLFPDLSDEVFKSATSDELCLLTTQDRFDVKERLSLTLTSIVNAKRIFLFLNGSEKYKLFSAYRELVLRNQLDRADKEPLLYVLSKSEVTTFIDMSTKDAVTDALDIILLGATGNLSFQKVLPTLFILHLRRRLPDDVLIYCYSRSKLDMSRLISILCSTFDKFIKSTLKLVDNCGGLAGCASTVSAFGRFNTLENYVHEGLNVSTFLDRLITHQCSGYGSTDDAASLNSRIAEFRSSLSCANRLIYLALPPQQFEPTIAAIKARCWDCNLKDSCTRQTCWTRVIIEKPFGDDAKSAEALMNSIGRMVSLDDVYLIDHYLGKHVVGHLMSIRFYNKFLSAFWNREYIESVHIRMYEKIGCHDRAGFYDSSGVIRDVVQNHLLQLLAITLIDLPASFTSDAIAVEKLKFLQSLESFKRENVAIGQYTTNGEYESYLDHKNVEPNSKCPTYFLGVTYSNHSDCQGIPLIIESGKGMPFASLDIILRLKSDADSNGVVPCIVINVQPKLSLELRLVGLRDLGRSDSGFLPMNMLYSFKTPCGELIYIEEAYEKLIQDAIRGDQSNFVKNRENIEQWRIVDTVIAETAEVVPESYVFNKTLPAKTAEIYSKFKLTENY